MHSSMIFLAKIAQSRNSGQRNLVGDLAITFDVINRLPRVISATSLELAQHYQHFAVARSIVQFLR
jgi:hypothetical protein